MVKHAHQLYTYCCCSWTKLTLSSYTLTFNSTFLDGPLSHWLKLKCNKEERIKVVRQNDQSTAGFICCQ